MDTTRHEKGFVDSVAATVVIINVVDGRVCVVVIISTIDVVMLMLWLSLSLSLSYMFLLLLWSSVLPLLLPSSPTWSSTLSRLGRNRYDPAKKMCSDKTAFASFCAADGVKN